MLPSWILTAPAETQQTQTIDNPDGSKTKFTFCFNPQPKPPEPETQTSTINNADGSKTKVTFMRPAQHPPPPSMYCPYSYPPPPQPTSGGPIIVILPDEEQPSPPPPPPPTPPPVVKPPPPPPPPPPPGPQRFSGFSTASTILFVLALVFGIACVTMTYQAMDGRMAGLTDDDEEYVTDRYVAVGTGIVATLLFHAATMCIFYAGMRYKSKSKLKEKRKDTCCLSAMLIGASIVFGITFMIDLVVLVVAFDGEKPIYPEVVWVALVGSMVAWMLMFCYSEAARRAG